MPNDFWRPWQNQGLNLRIQHKCVILNIQISGQIFMDNICMCANVIKLNISIVYGNGIYIAQPMIQTIWINCKLIDFYSSQESSIFARSCHNLNGTYLFPIQLLLHKLAHEKLFVTIYYYKLYPSDRVRDYVPFIRISCIFKQNYRNTSLRCCCNILLLLIFWHWMSFVRALVSVLDLFLWACCVFVCKICMLT